MSNYSNNPESCRVDFFKQSGKWYTTEAVLFNGPWKASTDNLIDDVFKKALRNHFKNNTDRLSDMDAICLEPYHEHSHPIQLKAGSWNKD